MSSWNDWRWQMKNCIRSSDQLHRVLGGDPHRESRLSGKVSGFPMSVTPYYASLIDPLDPYDPIRRCVEPSPAELRIHPLERADPLGEDRDSPLPGLVHRYPDRVLFIAIDRCPVYCRYCTRSRRVGRQDTGSRSASWDERIGYIRDHTEIRDVLVSGGDPLLLEDQRLSSLLDELTSIPHVEIIRIGTKVPAVLPQRITPALRAILSAHQPLWMNIHFTHPRELTPETTAACTSLASAGVPLGSQTVLLRGVNDDAKTLGALFKGLLRLRVRPYYLYQCDRVTGTSHFVTPIDHGLDIMEGLRGFTSGLALPHYVIDAPGGGGKIPLFRDPVVDRDDTGVFLRSYTGRICKYPVSTPGSLHDPTHQTKEEVHA